MVSLRRLALLAVLALAAPASVRAGEPAEAATCATPNQDDLQSLVDAVLCLAAAGQWGVAAQQYQRAVIGLAQHPLAEAGLLRLVRAHREQARFLDAAQLAELYAARHPESPAAPELLEDAAQMRHGLGQREQALADLDRLELLLQREDPARAAEVYWSRRRFLAGSEDERVVHARAFLKHHGKAAALDRRIVAEMVIAGAGWRRSCDRGLVDGLCARRRWPRTAAGDRGAPRPNPRRPARCGWDALRVDRRDEVRAADAQLRFAEVLRLAAAGDPPIPDDPPQRRREYEDAVGFAALHVADQRLEQLLEIEAPDGMSFQVDAWRHGSMVPGWERMYARQLERSKASQQRFRDYLERSTKLAGTIERQYAQLVSAQRSPRVAIAAMARLGQLAQSRADGLLGVEVFAETVRESDIKNFCAELRRRTDGLYDSASHAQTRCVDYSTHTGEFTEFSRLCEAALQRRKPREYPTLSELTFGGPAMPATRMEVIDVQVDPTPFMSADMGGT